MRRPTCIITLCIALSIATLVAAQTTSPAPPHNTTRPSTPPLWDANESVEHYAQRVHIGTVAKTILLGPKELPLELTLVPAGKFKRGNAEITVAQPFYLGITHVTVDQFTVFADASGYKTDAEQKGAGYRVELAGGQFETIMTKGASWRDPGFPQKGDHPVVMISWNDAEAFCQWLSKQTGRTFRLPTQPQWEFAARAGSTDEYIWGNGSGKEYANIADISLKEHCGPAGKNWDYSNWDDGFVFTSPGKSFRPNAFGLHDMIGNAWQWLDDAVPNQIVITIEIRRAAAPGAGNAPPANAPVPAPLGAPRANTSHPQRGASWNSRPITTSISRSNAHPDDYAYAVGGFRVELVLDASD